MLELIEIKLTFKEGTGIRTIHLILIKKHEVGNIIFIYRKSKFSVVKW